MPVCLGVMACSIKRDGDDVADPILYWYANGFVVAANDPDTGF
jgi:hypothetical protein